jgi:protein-S-isoprenylcysteine O-methyltransferase Ste14
VRSLIFTWPYGLIAAAVVVWAFGPEVRLIRRASTRQRSAAQPDPSLRWLLFAQNAGLLGALVSAYFLPQLGIRGARETVYWVGLALIVAGSLLRRHCWRMLGSDFTGNVEVRTGQSIVERGAYRWVRHPSYTAGLVVMIGIGLALGNWLSLALALSCTVIGYVYRVRVEEAALTRTLGEPYQSYMQRTWRFVPFVV